MPNDILTLRLPAVRTLLDAPLVAPPFSIRTMNHEDLVELAHTYLESYPPQIGAAHLDDALEEMRQTFAGEYGELLLQASPVAVRGQQIVGALMTTTHSVWDDGLEGPFIIDFFVRSSAQGQGLGNELLAFAVNACASMDASSISLRHGEGTSPAAHALYRKHGFVPLT